MVQIGNIHVGKAQTAAPPVIGIEEAAIVWDMLSARYKCLEETHIYYSFAKDPEFKILISKMGIKMLEMQAEELEKQCALFGIPMPKRPPKGAKTAEDRTVFSDEFMFRQIFEGCQHFIERLGVCIKSTVHNDPLREIYIRFLSEELEIFNNLCKYGKLKSWLDIQPLYKGH
jgi:hypothetical protein